MESTMEALMELMRKRLVLLQEGFSFPKDTIGGTVYYRALSPDGWLTTIDFEGRSEDWAIEKAWGYYCRSPQAIQAVGEWLKKYPNSAGLVYDDEKMAFIATRIIKKAPPEEAEGETLAIAVANWKVKYLSL